MQSPEGCEGIKDVVIGEREAQTGQGVRESVGQKYKCADNWVENAKNGELKNYGTKVWRRLFHVPSKPQAGMMITWESVRRYGAGYFMFLANRRQE